jgi:hypothetical protein
MLMQTPIGVARTRLAPGKDFIPIQSVPSSSSLLLQLQELFTVAGRTAVFVRKKPALGAGLRVFRQCRIPLGAKLAMRKLRFVGSLALRTGPLLPGFRHGLTPSSLGVPQSHAKSITDQYKRSPNNPQWASRSATTPPHPVAEGLRPFPGLRPAIR